MRTTRPWMASAARRTSSALTASDVPWGAATSARGSLTATGRDSTDTLRARVRRARLDAHRVLPDVERGGVHRPGRRRCSRGLRVADRGGRDRGLRDPHHRRRLHRRHRADRRRDGGCRPAPARRAPPEEPQARRVAEDGLRRGDGRPRPVHRRRPALRHGRARQGVPGDAALRGRHRLGLPLRPHRRGLRARRVLGDLQLAGPLALRGAAAGHQLRLQAEPAAGVRQGHAGERGVVHRRRADRARHAATATRSCSSASTTSPAREASRRSARRPSSSSCCGRCSRCEESCAPSSPHHAEGPDGRSPVPWRSEPAW